MKTEKIKSFADLKKAIKLGHTDFVIILNGGLLTTKFLFLEKGKIFTEGNTFDTWEVGANEKKFFKQAMNKGSFFVSQ
jgi:hypothetical protein